MKAISVRQPWADLIVQGKKTIELRTWSVGYRGPLAIHASLTVEREACLVHGLDPDSVTSGGFIGIVDLVDIHPLDAREYRERRGEHLATVGYPGPVFGWQLQNPRALSQPRPGRGRMGLFTAPDDLLRNRMVVPSDDKALPAPGPHTAVTGGKVAGRPFELRVKPAPKESAQPGAYSLDLFQDRVEPPGAQRQLYQDAKRPLQHIAELGDARLKAVADQVLDALKRSGYRATDLQVSRREPFYLDEESGVRLGLLFLAIIPVTKLRRIEAISEGIRHLTSEEAYYWYSKCTRGATAARAQKAFRVLLSDEG